ncbi:hypothetical protein VNO80_14806 [Phaseolus coccineus]|uniref:Uncharacterized protein n=1 Tax=Phaseolus coccineus TaxID=3886 RepID=A0AAN9R6D5_PHACN
MVGTVGTTGTLALSQPQENLFSSLLLTVSFWAVFARLLLTVKLSMTHCKPVLNSLQSSLIPHTASSVLIIAVAVLP